MSGSRCCCGERGPYTLASFCECSGGSPPAENCYVQGYDPATGCAYFGASAACWYVGPESPTKTTLDVGDYDLGTASFTAVEQPDLACCLCCECGASNATPVDCFDTPAGGCKCCPVDGDGSEWIISFRTEYQVKSGIPAKKILQVLAYGTIHYRNAGAGVCDRVLAIDITRQVTWWDSFGAVVCTISETIADCADLGPSGVAALLDFDTWGDFPCGERLLPQYFVIPCADCSGTCGVEQITYQTYSAVWDSGDFSGTDGCTWIGKTNGSRTTSGAIFFTNDCVHNRVVWNYETTHYAAGGQVNGYFQGSGFYDVQLVAPACPGGCGQRARYFGHGTIAPAEGNSAGGGPLVPMSLAGVLS